MPEAPAAFSCFSCDGEKRWVASFFIGRSPTPGFVVSISVARTNI